MDAHTLEPSRVASEGRRPGARRGAMAAGGGWRAWRDEHPFAFWWGLSLALALLTAIVWPTVPSYDPWSWIVWGREVTDPHISFYVGSGPSWKPLPFLFTTVYSVFGGAAPTLWVITARTGGIAGLIGVWRLSAILCRRAGLPAWSGAVAGFFAAAGIVLTAPSSGWSYYFFRGTSEPLLIGVWVWSIALLIERRHWQAFMLMAAEGLMRPEAWPLLLLYGAWLMWRQPSMRVWVLVGWLAQPVGWFVPPWISTGQAFLAAVHASEYHGGLPSGGYARLTGVLNRGEGLQPLPSLVLAVLGVLLAVWLGRDALPRFSGGARRWPGVLARWWDEDRSEVSLVLALAAATIAWWVIVVVMTMDSYPGLERFFLPAAAMTCAVSGYGLARVALIAGGVGRRLLGGAAAGPVAVGAFAAILLASTHYVGARWSYVREQEPRAATAVRRIDDLGRAITFLGGRARILPCASSEVTVNHSLQTALAWKLGTTLARVSTHMSVPGIAFVGPKDTVDGGEPPIYYPFAKHLLGKVGDWQLWQVWHQGTPRPACVGS